MKTKLWLIIAVLAGSSSMAQNYPDTTTLEPNILIKKFYWGASFNNALTKFKGDNLPNNYFFKPALGVTLKAEYYFHKYVGIGAGFTYQQKGTGIFTPDFDKSLGNPDSTHRARLKTNALEIPVYIIFRSGEVIKGLKLHGEVGVAPMKNALTKYVFYSIEDGFHFIENQNERYYKNDFSFHAAGGVDLNAGNASVFQVHFYGSWGRRNVFDNSNFPGADGRNVLYGIRLGWMF